MRGLWRRVVPAILLLLAAATPAAAEERIHLFWSDIEVQPDASLTVTETIDVRAEHNSINHGIYRDFPTRYSSRDGRRVKVGFTFQGATLDGQPVPASVTARDNGVRIKIGDPDKYVEIGDHRYTIRYRATRQLGYFKDYDELYWNVTGNGWVFAIDAAEVRIRLPKPARIGQRAAYTGAQGSTASNAAVTEEKPGEIVFRTTQPLDAYQGLTVAIAFPKGVVAAPSQSTLLGWWLADYGPYIIGAISLLGVLGFLFHAWQRAGRDPPAGTVVPIFSPPDDLTPAGMRYLTKFAADNRTFAAALVDMGVRGHIRMVEEEGGWFSKNKTRIERLEGVAPLPADEEAALRNLLSPGETVVMEQKNHAKFSAAKKGLDGVLKDRYENKLFKRNYGWAAAVVVAFVAAMWLTSAAIAAATIDASIWRIGVTLGSLAVAAMLGIALYGSSTVTQFLLGAVALGAAAVAVFTGLPVFTDALNSGWLLPLVIPGLSLPLVLSAFWWISAPTKEGRAVLDRIAGFKQYLSITERERLDRMTPPADTPQLFEKFLPYAIALGVENRWAERFEGVLAAAAAQGQQGFAWYSGSGNPWRNPTGFANSVGASLASTISSASTAPGSRSGSGGGGFSGGGGGGGGGGGW